VAGTPRSSIDIYSGSNESNETLASEYPAQFQRPRNGHFRVASKLAIPEERDGPESLTMGYAQVAGQFTLDGSLVNQAPFEEVKRKGVVGGSGGGGVVGIERKKRDTGIFGSLGLANFGESIGGLLGGAELSSIKEMRNIASSKAIPLLSTPQSVLFIDLTLATGEERSYLYSFTLPKGLPPSHKGRAIRISYHITIGILRPSSEGGQKVRSIDVPFRVFGTVNGGYSLGVFID
jgi:RAB6A-GEF complex partner protein 2